MIRPSSCTFGLDLLDDGLDLAGVYPIDGGQAGQEIASTRGCVEKLVGLDRAGVLRLVDVLAVPATWASRPAFTFTDWSVYEGRCLSFHAVTFTPLIKPTASKYVAVLLT